MSQGIPFVSVIVPTRNPASALQRCIMSIGRQDYPADRLEVVVVNDGGVPLPDEITRSRAPLGISVIDVPRGGPAAARNAGVAASRGDVMAFTDDDCAAEPGWLRAMVRRLQQNAEAVIGGRVVNALPDNRYSRASHHLISFLYHYYHEEQRGALPFFTTNNLAVRADVFARVGAFDAAFPFASEDRDWSDRCLHAGVPLVYAREAVVHHAHALRFGSFLHQHFRYGEGARRFHRSRAQRRGISVQLERSAFYADMLRAPFTAADPEALRVSALLAVSQAVGAIGWACQALRDMSSGVRGPAQPRGVGGRDASD